MKRGINNDTINFPSINNFEMDLFFAFSTFHESIIARISLTCFLNPLNI